MGDAVKDRLQQCRFQADLLSPQHQIPVPLLGALATARELRPEPRGQAPRCLDGSRSRPAAAQWRTGRGLDRKDRHAQRERLERNPRTSSLMNSSRAMSCSSSIGGLVSSHCRPSRNCQDGDLRAGTVKARRPRESAVGAERRALHGAEHRSSIDRVMAGASAVFRSSSSSARGPGHGVRPESALNLRQHSALHRIQYELAVDGQIFPERRDQIVRTIWFRSARRCQLNSAGASRTGFGHADNRHGTLTPMA